MVSFILIASIRYMKMFITARGRRPSRLLIMSKIHNWWMLSICPDPSEDNLVNNSWYPLMDVSCILGLLRVSFVLMASIRYMKMFITARSWILSRVLRRDPPKIYHTPQYMMWVSHVWIFKSNLFSNLFAIRNLYTVV